MTSQQFECKNEPKPGIQVATTRSLLHLATEVLIEILGYLPAADMISVQQTCRTIRDIIAGTAYLQYILRAEISGVNDFLLPKFLYSERLELLQRHEQSWHSLHFDLFTECDRISNMPRFTLQDGYLIHQYLYSEVEYLQYEYTDLCSAARNEDLRWVHVTMREPEMISPFPWPVIFAVDHDLVVVVSKQLNDHEHPATPLRFSFFEFTTGAPHPLSSMHAVSLPQLSDTSQGLVDAEVLGDHILVLVRDTSSKALIYLVSWKTGTATLLRESPDEPSMDRNGSLWIAVINSSLVALINEVEHSLEICKLETPTPGPYLQTLCFFELPPLASAASLFVSSVLKEWVPTSKHHAQSRSSRGCHLPFYSPTVGTIALRLVYGTGIYGPYAVIISVPALLSAIPTGVRNVPWVDWGPSSTHMLRITTLTPAGPFWITRLVPLEVRRYDLRRTQCIRSTAKETSLLFWLLNSDATEVIVKSFGTHMPYRDARVPASDMGISCSVDIVADREWVVVAKPLDGERTSVAVYHAG